MAESKSRFDMGGFSGVWSDDRRKDLLFLARTAESAERYDDMCKCMKQLVEVAYGKEPLSVDERNLLSVAYKNVIGARRASWRTLNAETQDGKNPEMIKKYKKQVEEELEAICNEIIDLLEKKTIQRTNIYKWLHLNPENQEPLPPPAPTDTDIKTDVGEEQVFYLKMAGDYYRYLAEACPDQKTEQKSAQNYGLAYSLAEKVLMPTHPIRLGLALNYSVCHYEILKDKKKACQLAKDAFDEAISKLDKLEEADYKDSTLIMQLLRDNLTLWTSTDGDDESEENVANDGDGD